MSETIATGKALRQTERYMYWSIHWGFPMLPAIGGFVLLSSTTPNAALAWWAVALTLAGCAGLVVTHTTMRRRALLGASRWDRLCLVERRTPWLVGWAVASVAAAALFWSALPPVASGTFAAFLPPAALAFTSALCAVPLLVLDHRRRLLPAALGGTALCLVGTLSAPTDAVHALGAVLPAAVWSVSVLSLAQMMLNLLATTKLLDQARLDGARLAVTEERLRFSRDVHDVVGRTLSAVALKAELAAAQASAGRPEASATMREVQGIATEALAEVRAVVRGYREADLAAEVAGARALLEAGGITVATVSDTADLPGPVRRTFAWVVREASTNILRHSDASRARLGITRDASGAVLTVTNDRSHAPGDTPGSGLTGLTERLAEIGGTLTADRNGDTFTLTAHIPSPELERLAEAERSQT